MKKILFIIFLVIYPTYSFAYIDPGTVSIILQGLIGALAAIIVTLKIYWDKVLKLFGIRKKIETEQDDEKNKILNNNKKD